MKKLFEKPGDWFSVEVEQEVYEQIFYPGNRTVFYNSDGEEIKYEWPAADWPKEDNEVFLKDTTAVEELGGGFYSFSTHPVTYEMGEGYTGVLGIKDSGGRIIVDEIYGSIDGLFNGLFSVQIPGGYYGCIDKIGKEVISFSYDDCIRFNEYGIAMADDHLIDLSEKVLEDTRNDVIDGYHENDRYFFLIRADEEQLEQIKEKGTAEGLTESVYDTKNRSYVVRNIPECTLKIYTSIAEPEVIAAAAEMLKEYEEVKIEGKGTIFALKNGITTVFDFYQE